TAVATGLTTGSSTVFNVTPGAASRLVFTVQPTTTVAGATITPAVQVTAQDAHGNTATAFSGSVTVAIGMNPGGGALSGTSSVAAAGGIATFSGLSINKTGTGYTLTAGASGVGGGGGGGGGATIAAFSVTAGAPSALVFSVQPTSATAGAAITPVVQVTAEDAQGNVATAFSGSVTVALGANSGGGTLGGTATVTAAGGVTTFSGLSVNKAGSGYTLTATATGLRTSTSAPFAITVGALAQLVFTVQPTNVVAGTTIAPAVQGTGQDVQGNTATAFGGTVTVAIGTNPGGGTLSGTPSSSAVNGVATFAGLNINRAGAGYTLAASATGLGTVPSPAFNVTAGAATQLVFTVEPSAIVAGATITPAVQVTAQDALGNTDPSFTGQVTVALGANPGSAILAGIMTVAATNGVATFTGLSLDKTGTGYTLTAAAGGLTGGTSNAFNVTAGAATQLVFSVQPTSATAGSVITP